MSKISQRVELVANILIIVVAALLIGVLVHRYFLSPEPAADRPAPMQPTAGEKVNLPDVDWSQPPKTLILALQSTCRYCTESAPFYKQLQERARGQNVRLLAIFPGRPEESLSYLGGLGIQGLEVKQAPLNALRVGGTPTLILANDKGEVTHFWIGKLSSDQERAVLEQLTN